VVKSLSGLRVFSEMRGKDLGGDDALEPCVQRTINLAHAASSER
jgi:hypothetical protein